MSTSSLPHNFILKILKMVKYILIAFAVKRQIDINKIDRFIGDVITKYVKAIAKVKSVH